MRSFPVLAALVVLASTSVAGYSRAEPGEEGASPSLTGARSVAEEAERQIASGKVALSLFGRLAMARALLSGVRGAEAPAARALEARLAGLEQRLTVLVKAADALATAEREAHPNTSPSIELGFVQVPKESALPVPPDVAPAPRRAARRRRGPDSKEEGEAQTVVAQVLRQAHELRGQGKVAEAIALLEGCASDPRLKDRMALNQALMAASVFAQLTHDLPGIVRIGGPWIELNRRLSEMPAPGPEGGVPDDGARDRVSAASEMLTMASLMSAWAYGKLQRPEDARAALALAEESYKRGRAADEGFDARGQLARSLEDRKKELAHGFMSLEEIASELEKRPTMSAAQWVELGATYLKLGKVSEAHDALEAAAGGMDNDLQYALTGQTIEALALAEGATLLGITQHPSFPALKVLAAWELSLRKGRLFDSLKLASFEADAAHPRLVAVRARRAERSREFLRAFPATAANDQELSNGVSEVETGLQSSLVPSTPGKPATIPAMTFLSAGAPRGSFPRGQAARYHQRLRGALPGHSALVDFALYGGRGLNDEFAARRDQRFVALIIRPDQPAPAFVDLGSAGAIEQAAQAFREAAKAPGDLAVVKAKGAELYALVWAPLKASLGGASHVIVSPDAGLHGVAFEALFVPDKAAWLGEAHEISYAGSSREVLPHPSRQRNPAVIFGDVVTNDGPRSPPVVRGAFKPLANVAREMEEVAELLPESKVLRRAAATEQNLLGLRSPSVLHVATHAFYLPDAAEGPVPATRGLRVARSPRGPTDSRTQPSAERVFERAFLSEAIVTSPPGDGEAASSADRGPWREGPAWDGFASAYEILSMDLLETELVVLSACQTGEGGASGRHGVASLERAFAVAGARSVVSAYWSVWDAAALPLMKELYRRLSLGEPRSVALHAAMAMVRSTSEGGRHPFEHPYYWAPFALTGQFGPLPPGLAKKHGR